MDRLYEIRKRVADYIKQNSMTEHGDVIVAGVSGGADSMCLLNLLLDLREELGIEIVAVHVHHGIRGEAADGDMEYVREFCRLKGIEFAGFHFDIPAIAAKNHISEEEAGRIKRYEAFNQVCGRKISEGRSCKIAVAHNMDDNSETFLFNLFRGTGLTGLVGIRPVRDRIIRPVMCLSRGDIEEYLKEKEIEYKTDATNLETDYTRNKIRLKLLPYIEENINAGARGNINRAAAMLAEVSSYMEKQALAAYSKNVSADGGENIHISGKLWEEDAVIIKLVVRMAVEKAAGRLKDITAKHIEGVAELYYKQVSKAVDLPYGVRAVRTYEGVALKKKYNNIEEKIKNTCKENLQIEEKRENTRKENLQIGEKNSNACKEEWQIKDEKANGKVQKSAVEQEKNQISEDRNVEACVVKVSEGRYEARPDEGVMTFFVEKRCIDESFVEKNISPFFSEKRYTKIMNCDILKDKLAVRHRKSGDYMIIDSAGRKKKLKDMLIDLKIPREERDDLLLLASGQEILWIVGYRMSERCKVNKTDCSMCRVTFTRKL